MLIDLAGEDEALRQGGANTALDNPDRDLTAVTVVELDFSLLGEDLMGKPIYKVVNRQLWQGEKHSTLYARLLRLADLWQPEKIVVDASGVGAGVGSFLRDKLGEKVIALQFTRQLKSRLGWGFLAVVDTGRFQDFSPRSAPEQWSANPLLGRWLPSRTAFRRFSTANWRVCRQKSAPDRKGFCAGACPRALVILKAACCTMTWCFQRQCARFSTSKAGIFHHSLS